jgi:superfamily I DNA and/or RNA helicase
MNVAITRAREMLIVIGRKETLNIDEHWKSLVEYTYKN